MASSMSPQPPSDLFSLDDTEGAVRSPPDGTEQAPSFVERTKDAPLAGAKPVQMQDFVIVRELGKGGLAQVYLAHQLSLDRKVALKLSKFPSRGEGQILAGLEHDHIVKVYTEFHDPESGQHGLVLQYIPGTHLGKVLEVIFREGAAARTGSAILKAVDSLAPDEVEFNPAALRDRELFDQGDYAATICRLGARLAEALAFAHSHGILHCDIKPANILLNAYGRPLLVDFNVAVPTKGEQGAQAIGGTLPYMAPEQLAFFNVGPVEAKPVDHRADLYSLGLVLTEAIVGPLPPLPETASRQVDRNELLQQKEQPPERWLSGRKALIPTPIWRVLRRCLDPDPAGRFPGGLELSVALRQAADLHQSANRLPTESGLSGWARRSPISVLLLLTLVPHLIGSVINIAYNSVQIPLDPRQRDLFNRLVLVYNVLAYPVCLALGAIVLLPLGRATRRIAEWPEWPASALDRLRRRSLNVGFWVVVLALIGWLPGGLFFPICLHLLAGPIGWEVFGHFLLSFTLSGLIALIYSYLGVQFVVLRSLYPRLAHAEQEANEVHGELRGLIRPLGAFPFLAALVPLVGATLLVALAPAEFTLTFRLLVTALIGAGLLGLGITVFVTGYLGKLVHLMDGAGRM